ncbi:Vacuolar morphogenesis protein 6 [Massospora cicadina]|nr:Vacuolar morphogenesis protein 6 [Massospora cicadina]
MYKAFESALLLEKLPVKVESLAHHRQTLYVGTATGVLLVYRISAVQRDDSVISYLDEFGEGYTIELSRSVKGFSKRAIEQLEVVPELGLLLALTDGQVNAYELSGLQFQASLAPPNLISGSRGNLKFSVFTGIAQLATETRGETHATPTLVTRVCIASKKLLKMLVWVDSEFAADKTKDFPLPDRMNTGEVVPTDRQSSRRFCAKWGEKLGGCWDDLDIHRSSEAWDGQLPSLFCFRISDGEIIVVKGEVGLFAGPDGLTTRRTAIHFPVEPLLMTYSYPYLLIVSAKQVEVRNLDSQATVMIHPINCSLAPVALTRGKAPFLATPNQVWRWVPTHFADQINTLISAKLFEEALTLFEQNKDRVSEVKTCSADQIRELYALELFHQGQFERALNLAFDLRLPPTQIIGLFPAQISGAGKSSADTRTGNEPYHHTSDTTQWPRPRLLDATQALIKYLTQIRTQLVTQLTAQPPKQVETLASDMPAQMFEATLVDTTLVRCYLLTNHAMIGPLLRVNNYVDIQIATQLLTSNSKFQELVDFYYAKGLHRKALQLLKSLGQEEQPTDKALASFSGVAQSVQYLMRLGGDHFDIITEFSSWCLAKDPQSTMPLFVDDHATAHTLPAQGILQLLEQSSFRLAFEYLNRVLPAHHVGRPELLDQIQKSLPHPMDSTELAVKLELFVCHPSDDGLRLEIYKNDLPSGDAMPDDVVEFSSTFRCFVSFLLAEPALYKPEKLLGQLPTAMFFKPRALVLSRLKRHDQALNLLVYRLQDIDGAEDYCRRFNSKDVFKILLKTYLDPASSDPNLPDNELPYLEPALQLLDKHGARIDAAQALDFLPNRVKMLSLGGFLTQNLRHLVASAHEARIQLSLLRAESVRLSCRLAELKADPVPLDATTLCPVCLKKIGTSAFAIFPDRQVVHYSCQAAVIP